MHCVNCGRAVPDAASFCPGCGASTDVRTNRPAPVAAPRDDNPLAKMSGCSFVLLVIGVLYLVAQLGGNSGQPATSAPITASDAAAKAKVCDNALATLSRAGVVVKRPSADEIDVDELAWAALPADQKRIFAAAVRCSALRGQDHAADMLADGATVEGYHSGKTLAIATGQGVTLN